MKRILVLVIASFALLLTSCEFIDQLVDQITGAVSGGGSQASGDIVSTYIAFSLQGNVSKQGISGTSPLPLGSQFPSGSGTYDPSTRTFTASWDNNVFSNTQMTVRLNPTEEYVEYFYARQIESYAFGGWSRLYEIEGINILYSHAESNSKYYIVDGATTNVIVTKINYKDWSKTLGSEGNPNYWLTSPTLGNIWADTTSHITIRVDM